MGPEVCGHNHDKSAPNDAAHTQVLQCDTEGASVNVARRSHAAGSYNGKLATQVSGDEFWDDYQSNGDAAEFGARWAGIFAAGAFPSLATGLHSGPDDPRTAAILDRLETEVAGRLAAAPARMRIPAANVVLTKIRNV